MCLRLCDGNCGRLAGIHPATALAFGWVQLGLAGRLDGPTRRVWLGAMASICALVDGFVFAGLGLVGLGPSAPARRKLFVVLALVWAADVFAYFFGRTLGGRIFAVKLAPTISPGKSWEGVFGGVLGVFAVSWLWIIFDQTQALSSTSFFTLLWARGIGVAVPALLFMSAMSVVGDLVESLVKRSAGMKDSSGLLPGHGGVLDRVDALLPTLPLAMMLVAWI